MKKNNQIFITTALVITIVLVVTFQFYVQRIETGFTNYYSKQLDTYGGIINKTVEMAASYTDTYEQLLTDDLYYKLSALNQELQNVPLEELNPPLLEQFKEKYDLTGLAIFSKDSSEEIHISHSTIQEEIGKSTGDWGYWNDAFQSLFNGEEPPVNRGSARGPFWMGPRSRSHHLPGYFRFAYYYNETQNYLINAFVEDDNSYDANIKNLLQDLFVYFNEDVGYIESASLIDLKAWEKAYYNDFKNLEDPAVTYGRFKSDFLVATNLTPEELFAIQSDYRTTITVNEKEHSLLLINAGVDNYQYLIAALLNDQDKQLFKHQAGVDFVSLAIFTIMAVLSGVFYIMQKYSSLLTFQMERNEAIEKFSKSIASLPEFIYKCKLDSNGELLLTYNDGKVIEQDKYVPLESSYCLMTNLYPAEYVSTFKTNLANVFNGSPTKFEIDYVGEHYEHFVSPIFDQQNEVVEIIGFATNITDRRIADEQSKYLASHDALTGLMNRVTFEENVKMQIDKEPNSTYAIMFLDLDKFKALNDTFGHIAGDLALQEVSTRLIQGISSYAGGFVARMGGDEFAIFLPYTKKQHIISLAEALILSISKPYLLKENTASLGVSIGIALYQEDSSVYKQLIHFSDMAMYEAKTTADCNYKFFEKDFLL